MSVHITPNSTNFSTFAQFLFKIPKTLWYICPSQRQRPSFQISDLSSLLQILYLIPFSTFCTPLVLISKSIYIYQPHPVKSDPNYNFKISKYIPSSNTKFGTIQYFSYFFRTYFQNHLQISNLQTNADPNGKLQITSTYRYKLFSQAFSPNGTTFCIFQSNDGTFIVIAIRTKFQNSSSVCLHNKKIFKFFF